MKPGSTYYAGGARVVIAGIPIRLARKPSPTNLADMRICAKETGLDFSTSRERAMQRVAEAKHAIEIYAATLGISTAKAKRRIDKQRLHVMENPLVDLSLEYDL